MEWIIPPGVRAGGAQLAAGQVAQGAFNTLLTPGSYDTPSGLALKLPQDAGESLSHKVQIVSFYVPFKIFTVNTNGQPQAGVAHTQMRAISAGVLIWTSFQDITLNKLTNLVNSAGFAVFASDLTNPVDFYPGYELTFQFSASFDAGLSNDPLGGGNGWVAGISQVPQNPNTLTSQSSPGIVSYRG